jgi:hypothetical protein
MESCKARNWCPGRSLTSKYRRTGQRANVFITADFNLDPSFVKRKRLNVRSVYAEVAPVHIPGAADAQGMSGSAAIEQNVEQDDCRGRQMNTAYNVVVVPVLQLLPDEEDPVIVHEQEWVRPQYSEDVMALKCAVSPREWFIRTPTGEMLRPDGDRDLRSPLDYFLLIMLPSQLSEMTR